MNTRQGLLSEFDWRCELEDENLTEAMRELVPAFIVLDRFGWASHPPRDGWIRWSTFDREGRVAVAEARVESPMIIVRAPGVPPTAISNRAHLLAEACGFAKLGFGVTPCVDELLATLVWLTLDASGLGNHADLALASLLMLAKDVSSEDA